MEYGVKIVDNKRVQYSELIGAGANMTVFKGTVNGKAVALKRIRPFHNETRQKRDLKVVLASLEMEIRVMSDVFLKGHENIAKLLAFTWETGEDGELVPVLIMDLATPGCSTLEQYMQQVDPRDFDSKAWMISDIVSGLTAIHEEKIVHGDLKPENILLFRRQTAGVLDEKMPAVAKISDFGFCEDVHEHRGLAPEYGRRFHTGEGAPSLLHLAALGKGYFSHDKMWVYLDENEVRDDPEEAKMDQPNHQRLIL